jgi:murein endopeptidase
MRPSPASIHRLATLVALCAVLAVAGASVRVTVGPGSAQAQSPGDEGATLGTEQIDQGDREWRGSVAVGLPQHGWLFRGELLPSEGTDFFTWDFPLKQSPNRPWRRWATDRTIDRILTVLAEYRTANPGAPRVGIADLSRPNGGNFGKRFGGLGHASHQNGTDADILYPRRDHQELAPSKASQIERSLSQDLVDRFVAAGAEFVFVGPHTKLTGPRKVVEKLVYHDDHMHVRFFNRGKVAG